MKTFATHLPVGQISLARYTTTGWRSFPKLTCSPVVISAITSVSEAKLARWKQIHRLNESALTTDTETGSIQFISTQNYIMSKKYLKHSASKLVTRLSLMIMAQTLVTFVGIWLLFFFPGIGANEKDLLESESHMLQIAQRIGLAAAQRDNPNTSLEQTRLAGALINKLFVESQSQFDGVSRQVVYRISDNDLLDNVTVVSEWSDDMETGMRIPQDVRNAEMQFVRSMRATHPEHALRVISDLNRVTWYSLWVDDSESSTGVEYIYQITLSSDPPILGGWRFMNTLAAFFLSSILISLMTALALQSKLSNPLKALSGAFEQLSKNDSENTEPVNISIQSNSELAGLISAFNQMSEQLHKRRKELKDSDILLHQTNTELSKSKNFLETILESSPLAIIVSDLAGEILLFNRAGRGEFGFSDEEDIPAHLNELFVASGSCPWPRELDQADGDRSERVCVRPDGSHFPALVVMAPLKGAGGSTNGYLYLVRDISESENFKEMIIRLDHLSIRGEMAGDIAHEINNFLAIIQGNAELLPMLIEKGNQEKVDKRLELIRSTVTKIAVFTEGLMNFESHELEFTPEDLNQLIYNLMEFLKPQKRLDDVTVTLEPDHELGIVTLDSGLIQQTLVNLIYNAADALSENNDQRLITISTQKLTTGRALISVSDNGPGVPENKQDQLFATRFTTKRKGHGIGLITCAKIIEAHNGRIFYQESDKGGSSFVIEIPLRQKIRPQSDTQPIRTIPDNISSDATSSGEKLRV